MSGVCSCIDIPLCYIGLLKENKGDGKEPNLCKKIFLPVTSVIDSNGYDKTSEIFLAYSFCCFYTLCCFKVKDANNANTQRQGRKSYELITGNGKDGIYNDFEMV